MKKYKIDWFEIKTSAKGAKYGRATITDENDVQTTNVAIFSTFPNFEAIAPGSEVEGELTQKDYQGAPSYSLEGAKPEGGKKQNIDRLMDKKATSIAEAQTNKAEQISKAQDKSAVMWAKYSASEIIAHHPAYQSLEAHEIPSQIHKLADIIYGDELSPF